MMFFETWWQGLIFGIVTTVGMLAVSYAFALRFKMYEDSNNGNQPSCKLPH